MKISLLLTGNELMSGDTVDSNSAYIAQSLKDISLTPYIKKVVGDDMGLLVSSIKELCAVSDVLIINGGLGPTVDDLTAQALSQATGNELAEHPQARAELEKWAHKYGFVITESNLKQAILPSDCDIIENPRGSAVGFSCVFNDCLVMCTPGVPSELKPMVEKSLLPLIKQYGAIDQTNNINRFRLFGITESGLQDSVNRLFPDWPADVDLGFRVQMPVLEVKIATIGEANDALNKIWSDKFQAQFDDYILGKDSISLPQALNQALLNNNKTLTLAESCTGGLIASMITGVVGSSAVFESGFVTYSNRIKQQLLGVDEATLTEHGAVSEQVVLEMAAGALALSKADIALAVSGVAGPDGGTDEKPVGTVWVAWGSAGQLQARHFYLPRSRRAFQQTIAAIAIDIIRRSVSGLPTDVDYFSELKRRQNSQP